ncbi:unnamed protein product [Ceutorhynchus assimilis]|uniref:Uncharacterized protein n=1 Tax=Ceutorhynchus assimilis TaxID=467358 RepID=A0A9N9MVR9_9CUCU|nr:unnamed protein product [Ceutorhynchus assimilis]
MTKVENAPKITEIIPSDKQKKHTALVKIAELNICMFLQEHNLPFLLAEHLGKCLPHICPDSSIAKSLACSRTKASYITKECLAKQQLHEIADVLKQTKFSRIIDETTDIFTEKSPALVVRYYDEKSYAAVDK